MTSLPFIELESRIVNLKKRAGKTDNFKINDQNDIDAIFESLI